jgi:hypothetical protein
LEPDDETQPERAQGERAAPVRLPSTRRTSPWSRRLLLIVIVAVALAMPIWLDPVTLDQFRGATPYRVPTSLSETPPVAVFSPGADRLFEVATTVARDRFERDERSGWGRADIGGAYRAFGAATVVATESGAGVGRIDPTAPGGAALSSVSAHDVEIVFEVTGDALAEEGTYVAAVLRLLSEGMGYRPTLVINADGVPAATVRAVVHGDELSLVPPVALGPATAANGLRVRAQAIGSDPTTIRLRAWPQDEPEPLVWHVSVIDWTGNLQHAGAIGLEWGGETRASTATLRFDDLVARANSPVSGR